MRYNRVVFARGTGLGNRLFPWARCVIATEAESAAMLAPHWVWPLRRGALFAGGISRAAYLRQGLLVGVFRARPEEVSGARRLWIEARGGAHEFRGEADQFRGLAPHRAALLHAFRASTRQRWLQLADRWKGAAIGINVRRGRDFHDAQDPADYVLKGGLRTPLAWFVEMLRLARRTVGSDVPAVVVSDGTPRDLALLLREPNVRMLRPGCPASDMLVLSQCRLILGSGGSSFTAWASFLGDVPVFTIPGQSLSWFSLDTTGTFVGTCDPAAPAPEYLQIALTLPR